MYVPTVATVMKSDSRWLKSIPDCQQAESIKTRISVKAGLLKWSTNSSTASLSFKSKRSCEMAFSMPSSVVAESASNTSLMYDASPPFLIFSIALRANASSLLFKSLITEDLFVLEILAIIRCAKVLN